MQVLNVVAGCIISHEQYYAVESAGTVVFMLDSWTLDAIYYY